MQSEAFKAKNKDSASVFAATHGVPVKGGKRLLTGSESNNSIPFEPGNVKPVTSGPSAPRGKVIEKNTVEKQSRATHATSPCRDGRGSLFAASGGAGSQGGCAQY